MGFALGSIQIPLELPESMVLITKRCEIGGLEGEVTIKAHLSEQLLTNVQKETLVLWCILLY